MTTYTVGKDIVSYCGKCKLALGHIIVSLVDETKIGKVKCNTCQAMHSYKDPALQKAKKTRKKSTRKKEPARPVAEVWQEELKKSKSEPVAYSIKTRFTVGDIVDHPKFGHGIIEEVVDNDKVSIMFESEIKTLMHNKS